MRWFKLGIAVIIIALVALFIYQNMPTFDQDVTFSYNLHISDKVEWTHSVLSIIFMSAGFGFLIGLLVMLKPWLNTRRTLSQERKAAKQASAACGSAGPETTKPAIES